MILSGIRRGQELYDELISGPFAHYFGQYAEALDAARKVQGPIKGGMLQTIRHSSRRILSFAALVSK